jgi:alcohol dehydrogenase
MVIEPFEIARLPAVTFGEGALARVPALAAESGSRALLVTGVESFRRSRHWPAFSAGLERAGIGWESLIVDGEPSPELVDDAVARFAGGGIEVVLGVGGGSVLDTAKAVAGLLPHGNSVLDHLEGVGRGVPYRGPALPFIAVPTTAGTGSEATQNAVLGRRGPEGFKKSFRHGALAARHAVIDPQLLESCPRSTIAADGMDALTQLVESFVSPRSSHFTEVLALDALEAVREGLLAWFEQRGDSRDARSRMAYAAWISGVVLAQTGLGAVHGLASPLGAFFPAPHGAVCGTLLAAVTRANVAALRAREPDHVALGKYARIQAVLAGAEHVDRARGPEELVALLQGWTDRLRLPRLSLHGMREGDVARVVAGARGSSMRTNPILLSDAELATAVRERL